MMGEPQRFRKKPVVIEAVQYDPPNTCRDVWEFLGWGWQEDRPGEDDYHDPKCDSEVSVYIDTMEGLMEASPGDWIIKGVKGEFYPCKSDIFEATYERVADDSVSEVPDGEAS